MRVTKTIGFLGVLLLAVLSAQNASALYTSSMDEWQGNRTYTEGGFNLVLEWAVYTMAENPFSGVTFPSGDQYIYAYQIINKTPSQDISFFSVLDLAGNPIAQSLMNDTQAVNIAASILPTTPSAVQGEWVWVEEAYVTEGHYSAYLIYSSPNAPTRGRFRIEAPEEEEEPPVPSPEPGTIALFGVASGFLIMKHRRKLQTK